MQTVAGSSSLQPCHSQHCCAAHRDKGLGGRHGCRCRRCPSTTPVAAAAAAAAPPARAGRSEGLCASPLCPGFYERLPALAAPQEESGRAGPAEVLPVGHSKRFKVMIVARSHAPGLAQAPGRPHVSRTAAFRLVLRGCDRRSMQGTCELTMSRRHVAAGCPAHAPPLSPPPLGACWLRPLAAASSFQTVALEVTRPCTAWEGVLQVAASTAWLPPQPPPATRARSLSERPMICSCLPAPWHCCTSVCWCPEPACAA